MTDNWSSFLGEDDLLRILANSAHSFASAKELSTRTSCQSVVTFFGTPFIKQIAAPIMPLQFFCLQAQPLCSSRSTDSQLDVSSDSKRSKTKNSVEATLAAPFSIPQTPNLASSAQQIFRPARITTDDDLESMLTIKRCNAFDEGDSEDQS